jgi:hypothetical protein
VQWNGRTVARFLVSPSAVAVAVAVNDHVNDHVNVNVNVNVRGVTVVALQARATGA